MVAEEERGGNALGQGLDERRLDGVADVGRDEGPGASAADVGDGAPGPGLRGRDRGNHGRLADLGQLGGDEPQRNHRDAI